MCPDHSACRIAIAGQLRAWWPGVMAESQEPFIVLSVDERDHPHIVHTLEGGEVMSRRMGDVLAWSDPVP